MDEEDLREAEEARLLETNRQFTGIGGPEGDTGQPRSLMGLLVPPIQETMGTKLLKKMGWKEGQGVGPRIMRRTRDLDEDQDSDNDKTFLFAPDNSRLVSFTRKDNAQGLDYAGEVSAARPAKDEDKDVEDDFLARSRMAGKAKKAKGAAFGVGVLNDDGEDDEDPYEIRPKTLYNKVIGGDKQKIKAPAIRAQKHVFVPKKAAALKNLQTARKCHDGRLPLPGFILSDVGAQLPDLRYPPPQVPEGWKGVNEQPSVPESSGSTTNGSAAKLDPRTRGAMLGETPLPGKSVFDFLKPDARNRIAEMTGKSNLPPALGEAPASSSARSTIADLVPHFDPNIALSALKGGYMPYGDDLEKRARYRSFLEVKAGLQDDLPERVPIRA
jgi:G patch domain-containing protein 1